MRKSVYQNWKFLTLILIVVLFIVWIGYGRKKHVFVGLEESKKEKHLDTFDEHEYCKTEQNDIFGYPSYNHNISDGEIPISILPLSHGHSYMTINKEENNIFASEHIKVGKRSKGETECLSVLNDLFNKPFYTVRPPFLKSTETGKNLELDCFNPELKLAVEYSGRQHFEWPSFPNFTKEQFLSQIRRDRFKRMKCDEYGVYLITVPYTVKLEDIYEYILDRIPYTLDRYLRS